MDVFVIRGLPGSRVLPLAGKLFFKPTDYVVDLTRHYETDQGNLFVTEKVPDSAQHEIKRAIRAEAVSRLCICGMMHKKWIAQILDNEDVEPEEIYWTILEGAQKPPDVHWRLYDKLSSSFEVDLVADANH